MNLTRGIAIVVLAGLGFGGTFTVSGRQSAAGAKPALVRGNVPGEWRYWGGDAWSTRYSPLDQINASNFGKLKVAWQWNASAFGQDEYYRTTPLYANGRLFTVATTRRIAAAIDPENGETLWMWRMNEGIRWQKAPRQFAGRGPAYWTDGASERVIVATPGYHLASLDARTGLPDPKFGKNGIVDLMDGLGFPLVPLAVDDAGPLVDQRRGAGAESAARRDLERGDEDRRRRNGRHRSRSRPDWHQLSAHRRQRRHHRRQLAHPWLLSDSTAQPAELRPRLRRPNWEATVEVQPCARARRVRRRYLGERDQGGNAGRREGERLGDRTQPTRSSGWFTSRWACR